jgi:hypothetical protein
MFCPCCGMTLRMSPSWRASLQFIAVLPTTNDQVVYASNHTQRQCGWVKTCAKVLSPLSRKINYSSSRYVSLISFFMIFACILIEGWSSCFWKTWLMYSSLFRNSELQEGHTTRHLGIWLLYYTRDDHMALYGRPSWDHS